MALWWGLGTALAAEPSAIVWYAGGDERPAALAAIAATGRPAWEVSPRTIAPEAGGAGGHRAIVEGQPAVPCAAPTSAAAVREALAKAESEVAYENWTAARTKIDEAAAAMRCLTEPAEASVGARVQFLSGIVRVSGGDAEGAETAFREAIAFSPTLAWDEAFTPDWRPPFDAAQKATSSSARVVLGPGLSQMSSVWLDGRPMAVAGGVFTVSEGPHLVQLIGQSIETIRLTATSAVPTVLVVPDQVGPDLANHAAEPATQAWLGLYAQRTWPERDVYAWTGTALLDAKNGFAAVPVPVVEAPRASPRKALFTGGIAAVGLGVVGAGLGYASYASHAEAVPGESQDAYLSRVSAAGRGAGMATLGLVLVGAGGATVAVSGAF